ncbi:MAG: DUF1573 domain-containing protein [Bacteroidales bacterium]
MKKIIYLFALFFIFSGFSTMAQQTNKEEKAIIEFDKKVHNYGTIHQNDDGTCEFKFVNTGNVPLRLTNVRSSCGCTVPKWPRNPIAAGDSGRIEVRYNTRRMGTINKHITVRSNAENNGVVLRIKGKVIKTPSGSPVKAKSEIQ